MQFMVVNAPRESRIRAFQALYRLYRRQGKPYALRSLAEQFFCHKEGCYSFTLELDTNEELMLAQAILANTGDSLHKINPTILKGLVVRRKANG